MARKTSGQWIVALKKGSVWGTAVALNSAGRMIKVLETGPLYKQREYIIDDSIGISFRQNSVVGKGFVDVTLSGILHFASPIWEIIAQIMGDDTVGAAGSDYSHVMKFQDTSAGLFSTLCAYDGNVVREIPSVKWTSFTIKGAGASLMEWTAKGIGNASLTTGQTNTALGSVTHVGDNYVPFNVTMHINDQSGDTLGASALVYASEFELSVDRKFEAEYLTSGTLYETGEPPAKGFTESILNVTFPYEQDNYTYANSHADHIAGNASLKKAFPQVPLIIGRGDAEKLVDPELNLSALFSAPLVSPPADRVVSEGDIVQAAGMKFQVLETPGHSSGHVVFLFEGQQPWVIFGGDVLFQGSVGRTDFPDGNTKQLLDSIRDKLFSLPPETEVYPGHGEPTTIGEEMETNPYVGGGAI